MCRNKLVTHTFLLQPSFITVAPLLLHLSSCSSYSSILSHLFLSSSSSVHLSSNPRSQFLSFSPSLSHVTLIPRLLCYRLLLHREIFQAAFQWLCAEVGWGVGSSLSRSATTADKQAGEQTGGHIHTHTRQLQTHQCTVTCTCHYTDGCTHMPATYLHMFVMLPCVRVSCAGCYLWCCGYLDEIFPSGFKWLKLMNEHNTVQTLQLFQTMHFSACRLISSQQSTVWGLLNQFSH